jgi:hypothetical protein
MKYIQPLDRWNLECDTETNYSGYGVSTTLHVRITPENMRRIATKLNEVIVALNELSGAKEYDDEQE